MKNHLHGFTLVELIVSISILILIFGLSSVNFLNLYSQNSINITVDTLISDLKQQQLKAMVGETEGTSSNNAYGIYFQSNKYMLYQGTPSDPVKFVINLDDNYQFSNIMVTGSKILFGSGSGEFADYDPNLNYVTLKNMTTEETKSIKLNKYGTVISVY